MSWLRLEKTIFPHFVKEDFSSCTLKTRVFVVEQKCGTMWKSSIDCGTMWTSSIYLYLYQCPVTEGDVEPQQQSHEQR